jgi:acyl-CoA synthetase (AMP-forming)/AMP-acid ligase II
MRNTCNRIEDLLINAASRFRDKIAIISLSENCEISFHTWLSDAYAFAGWLNSNFGDSPECVILQASNSYSFICAMFGGFIAGKTIVPISPKTDSRTLSFILNDCRPVLGLIDENVGKDLYIEKGCDVFELHQVMDDLKSLNHAKQYLSQNTKSISNLNDIALIIYTSGSTDLPKGVVCPHRQVLFATNAINSILCNSQEDVILCGLPFSFDYGLYQIFLMVHGCATLVVAEDFSVPMAIPYWIEKFKVTGFPGVPSLFQMLIESRLLERGRLDHLRYSTSTGDVFPVESILTLRGSLPSTTIFPMYGLTECKRVSILPPCDFEGHEASVGKALPGTKVFVVSEDGKKLPANEVGELVVQGPHVMQGYLNNPKVNSVRFDLNSCTNETWLHTGDIFRIDNEGFLFFEGRKQGFLKLRDQRISPIAIEKILSGIADVQQVAVVGVKDSLGRDSVFVFVRPEKGKNVTSQMISSKTRDLLPVPLSPHQVNIFKGTFPVTQNGKIDRNTLSELACRILKQ